MNLNALPKIYLVTSASSVGAPDVIGVFVPGAPEPWGGPAGRIGVGEYESKGGK
jgi:hypothetical protein